MLAAVGTAKDESNFYNSFENVNRIAASGSSTKKIFS